MGDAWGAALSTMLLGYQRLPHNTSGPRRWPSGAWTAFGELGTSGGQTMASSLSGSAHRRRHDRHALKACLRGLVLTQLVHEDLEDH
jgi:hypothetical protein